MATGALGWGQLGGALLSSILGGNSTTNTNSSMSGSSSSTPNLDPATIAMLSNLMQRSQGQLNPVNMSGYATGQQNQLVRDAALRKQALRSALASRGLSNSPISLTAENNVDNDSFKQLAQFRESLPLLSNQLMLQNLMGATGLFNAIPKGFSTMENQQGSSTTKQKSGLLGMF